MGTAADRSERSEAELGGCRCRVGRYLNQGCWRREARNRHLPRNVFPDPTEKCM